MTKIQPEKIAKWVETNFPDYKPRRDDEYSICNPFDGDTGHHMNINTAGVCHDWRGDNWAPINPKTGRHSATFINFVKRYRGCSWHQAVKEVMGVAAFTVPKQREVKDEVKELALPSGSVPIIDSPEPLMAKLVITWLKSRGIDLEQISEYRMHHMTSDVVWPYYEYDMLVYWQTRSALGKRFMFPGKDIAGKDFFYGFDNAEPASYVIITEAIFGALTLGSQALASGGASMSDTLVRKLTLLDPCEGVILAPDNDMPGINSISHNAPLIQRLKYKVYYSLPPKIKVGVDERGRDKFSKDWNDLVKVMSKQEILECLHKNLKLYNKFELARLMVGIG